jgi:hypothetical protein
VWGSPARNTKLSAANKGKSPSEATLRASVEARRDNPVWREKMRIAVWENSDHLMRQALRTAEQMANGGSAHIARLRAANPAKYQPAPEVIARAKITRRVYLDSPEGKAAAKKGYAKMASNPENLAKIRQAQDAWRASEKNVENCRRMARKAAEACSQKVQDPGTGITYGSQREAAKALGLSEAAVSKRIKAGKMIRVMLP